MTDAQVVDALGDDFLAYVCATTPQQIVGHRTGAALDQPQLQALQATIALARQMALNRRPNASNDDRRPPPGMEWEPLRSAFGKFCFLNETGRTIADRLRELAGGATRELPIATIRSVTRSGGSRATRGR
jgi:hypothetical protein